MKSRAAILLFSWTLAGASCMERPDTPPVPVETKTAVAIPCQVAEPQCEPPAYDAAQKTQPMDDRVKLLRAEAVDQATCLDLYRVALAGCRRLPTP